jgi:hypothetical protein
MNHARDDEASIPPSLLTPVEPNRVWPRMCAMGLSGARVDDCHGLLDTIENVMGYNRVDRPFYNAILTNCPYRRRPLL